MLLKSRIAVTAGLMLALLLGTTAQAHPWHHRHWHHHHWHHHHHHHWWHHGQHRGNGHDRGNGADR